MNFKQLLFLILILVTSISANAVKFDESNEKSEQNYFVITTEAINVQKDETIFEQQRLSKEAQYQLTKEIKLSYLNEMWATFSATMIMVVDLFIMFFLLIFIRMFVFITFELFPYGVNKLVDNIEEGLRK